MKSAMNALKELLRVNDIYKECMPHLIEIIDEVYLPMEQKQMELTEEEIFNGIIEHCKISHDRILAEVNAMIDGAKWYSKQLKQKYEST